MSTSKHKIQRQGNEYACSCGLRWHKDDQDPHFEVIDEAPQVKVRIGPLNLTTRDEPKGVEQIRSIFRWMPMRSPMQDLEEFRRECTKAPAFYAEMYGSPIKPQSYQIHSVEKLDDWVRRNLERIQQKQLRERTAKMLAHPGLDFHAMRSLVGVKVPDPKKVDVSAQAVAKDGYGDTIIMARKVLEANGLPITGRRYRVAPDKHKPKKPQPEYMKHSGHYGSKKK